MPVDDAERLQQAVDARAGGVDGQPRGDLDGRAPLERSRALTPVTRRPVDEQRAIGFDVVRQHRAVLGGREGERERQPIGFGHDVVVPDRGAGQPLPPQPGKALNGRCRGTTTRPPGSRCDAGTPRLRPDATRRSSRKPARMASLPRMSDR